jgi:hypothetical protein
MAATTKPTVSLTISPEVPDDARRRGLDCFPALIEIAQRVFAEADSITVFVEFDPEIAELSSIVFKVVGGWQTFETENGLRKQWYRETEAVCPKSLLCEFALHLYSRES